LEASVEVNALKEQLERATHAAANAREEAKNLRGSLAVSKKQPSWFLAT